MTFTILSIVFSIAIFISFLTGIAYSIFVFVEVDEGRLDKRFQPPIMVLIVFIVFLVVVSSIMGIRWFFFL